uniref:Sulfotransferase n=1 Tax=Ciona savignyi TaxID=51511 RepID=H2ZCE0_CIOSA
MKVIVAGMSKTGTKTMTSALVELGFNVHDYMEHFEYFEKEWTQILTSGGSTELFRKMYENVDAVSDLPACAFWDEILKACPDSKIVFTMRESEEKWWESMKNQQAENSSQLVNIMFLSPTGRRLFRYGSAIVKAVIGQDVNPTSKTLNEMLFKMAYRRHNAHVLQNAPKDQLLVFNFKDGWDPLCQFLGVPVPKIPFPHKNKNASITTEILKTNKTALRMQQEFKIIAIAATCLATFALYKSYRIARRLEWKSMFFSVT